MKNILVTGASGYIASHTIVRLFEEGYNVVGIDNFCNSSPKALENITKLTGKKVKFYEGDLRDTSLIEKIFFENEIYAVIHFGGLKSNAESIEKPELYYDVNLNSTRNVLAMMKKYGCHYIIFSGSATVYGDSDKVPIVEEDVDPKRILSPYGMTKYENEVILKEYSGIHREIHAISLRYFNPVGAHPSGILGEDNRQKIPNCLFPYLLKVAKNELPYLNVFGDQYNTRDGTGIRDYIHIMDLADGHIAALNYISKMKENFDVFNLGTGMGSTVLELVHAFEEENGIKIPYKIAGNRPGDMPISYANVDKANKILKWKTKYTINDCVRDAWNFAKDNKNI